MAAFCDLAKRVCKELLFDIGGNVIANGIVDLFKRHVGTSLNEGQTVQLRRMMNNAIVQYRAGREIGPIVSGIVALVAPGNELLVNEILSNIREGEAPGQEPVEVPREVAARREAPRSVQSRQAQEEGQSLYDSWFGGAFGEFPGVRSVQTHSIDREIDSYRGFTFLYSSETSSRPPVRRIRVCPSMRRSVHSERARVGAGATARQVLSERCARVSRR